MLYTLSLAWDTTYYSLFPYQSWSIYEYILQWFMYFCWNKGKRKVMQSISDLESIPSSTQRSL